MWDVSRFAWLTTHCVCKIPFSQTRFFVIPFRIVHSNETKLLTQKSVTSNVSTTSNGQQQQQQNYIWKQWNEQKYLSN